MPIAHARGLPPNVEPCSPGRNTPRTSAIGDDGGQRHDPAAERLAEDVHVGDDALVLAGERRAGPAETRLDLVRHQEDAALGAELAGRTEVPLGRHDHARLALDRFDEERDRVVIDRGAKRFHISVRDGPEPRGERAEAALRGRIVGEPDDRDRSPMEVPVSDDDLRAVGGDPLHVVAPPPRGLDRGLDGLGAGVHGEHHVLVREVGEIAAEHRERVVVERARGERDQLELRVRGLDQPWVAMSEVERGVRREHVEVSLPLDVGHPGSLPARDDDRKRVVVVGRVALGKREQFLRARAGGLVGCHPKAPAHPSDVIIPGSRRSRSRTPHPAISTRSPHRRCRPARGRHRSGGLRTSGGRDHPG